jgi:DNA-binding beta-propeller fold protein YncE
LESLENQKKGELEGGRMRSFTFALGLLVWVQGPRVGLDAPREQDKPYTLVKEKEIAPPGGTSFDYVSVDPSGTRIYLAHSPKIDVIDPVKGEKIGEVDGVEGAHGAIAVPEVKRGFATAGRKAKLMVFDLETFKVSKEIDTGKNPDALLYVRSAKEVWTFNGQSKDVTCVDASTLELKATIRLEGKPEAAVEHAAKGLVYVNLEDKSTISAIEIQKHEVAGTHSIAPGEGPTGLAFDLKRGLLFSGCGNRKMAVVDVESWKVLASPEIAQGCDGVVYDPTASVAIASCTGGISLVQAKDGKTFEPLPGLGDKGKTSAFDEKGRKLYVASGPRRGEKGEVKVVVYAPKP